MDDMGKEECPLATPPARFNALLETQQPAASVEKHNDTLAGLVGGTVGISCC